MSLNKLFNQDRTIVIIIILIALIKYFYQALAINPFEFDQEFLCLEALKIIKNHKFTLIGAPTSVGGLFIGPVYTYLVTLFMWLTKLHPATINILGAIWSTLTPPLIYLTAKKIFSSKTAVYAGILSALSTAYLAILNIPPLVIPLSLVSVLAYYFLSQINQQPHYLIYFALVSGIALNLHITGAYLPVIAAAWIIFSRPKINFKIFIKSLLVFLIFLLPLLLFELRHKFFISQNLIIFLSQHSLGSRSFFSSLYSSLLINLRANGELLNLPPILMVVTAVVIISFFGLYTLKNKQNQQYKLLFFWLSAPLLLNSLYSGQLLPYYFIIQQAQFFIAAGIMLSYISQRQIVFLGLLSLIAINGIFFFKNLFQSQNGLQLQNKMAAFSYIKQKAGQEDINLTFTVDYPHRGGIEFLTHYYNFDSQYIDTRPTYTIVIPSDWQNIKSKIQFGKVGVTYQ